MSNKNDLTGINKLKFSQDWEKKVELYSLRERGLSIKLAQAIVACFGDVLTQEEINCIAGFKDEIENILQNKAPDAETIDKYFTDMNEEFKKIYQKHKNENQALNERKQKFSQFYKKYPDFLIYSSDFSDKQIQKLEKLMMNLNCLNSFGKKRVTFSEFMQMTQLTTDIIDGWDDRFLGCIINISNKSWEIFGSNANGPYFFIEDRLPIIIKRQKPDDIDYIAKEKGKKIEEKDYAMLCKYIDVFNFESWGDDILKDILKKNGSLFSSEDMEKLYELTLSYKVLRLQTDKIKFFTVIGEFYNKDNTTS